MMTHLKLTDDLTLEQVIGQAVEYASVPWDRIPAGGMVYLGDRYVVAPGGRLDSTAKSELIDEVVAWVLERWHLESA
jgi:hypothetical protein